MRSLPVILRQCFENISASYTFKEHLTTIRNEKSAFLTIPVSNGSFEIPVFTSDIFDERILYVENPVDAVVVNLRHYGYVSQYKVLNTAFRDSLDDKYGHGHYLVGVPFIRGLNKLYYLTRGAVFDSDFHPIIMLSWQVERVHLDTPPQGSYSQSGYYIKFISPIMRIAPEVILNKDDSMKRYIVNTLLPTVLSLQHISAPNTVPTTAIKIFSNIKVIIGSFPFSLKEAEAPSISTTNEQLLNVALSHIDEVVQ